MRGCDLQDGDWALEMGEGLARAGQRIPELFDTLQTVFGHQRMPDFARWGVYDFTVMSKPPGAQLPSLVVRKNSGRNLQTDGKTSACRKNDHNHCTSLRCACNCHRPNTQNPLRAD